MWKLRYGFVCALLGIIAASHLISTAQTADPSTLPRIQFADLSYLGAFRLPKEFANGDSFQHGGSPITFNPGRNSLFIGSRAGNLAEVKIPGLVVNSDITKLQFATYLQGFYEPTEGTIGQLTTGYLAGSQANITGLLVMGKQLYGTASVYYDANNNQQVSHYARSTVLSTPGSTVGMRQVWSDYKTGFVSGYMSTVPTEWQQKLGGPALTGQCCIPIAWRTSWGPSAFAFNPPDLYSLAKVPAQPVLYYSDSHSTLGRWEENGTTYSASTEITGMAVLAGTRTVLYVGRIGEGQFCYGDGTSNPSLVGTIAPDTAIYCYDLTNNDKGVHAYPYHYQIWAYDLNDLAAVKAGAKNPWDVKPYGVWPLALPYVTSTSPMHIGGVGYDASRQILYISQKYGDQDTYENRPVIHAFKIGGGAIGPPLPAPDTTPLPPVTTTAGYSPGGARLTALALVSNKIAPQPADTSITFTATPTGGTAPHEYKWLVHDGTNWNTMVNWSTASSVSWTPNGPNSQYRVGVWVRSAGLTADTPEFTASMDYPIANATTWTAPIVTTTAVSIAPNKAAPQAAGSMITWTATPTGGTAPHQYKWLLHNGTQWTTVSDWSTSNTFVWTPAIPNSQYRVGVWVRSGGKTGDVADATSSADFAINGVAVAAPAPAPAPTPTPTTTTSGPLTALSLTPNKPAPQPAGTAITFTSVPTGGVAPHQFKFLIHDGTKWNEVTGWSTSNAYTWTPTAAGSQYRVGVWVRNAGSTADAAGFTNSMDYPVSAGSVSAPAPAPAPTPTPAPAPTTTTGGPLTSVTLGADKIAPQPQNTTINFTAIANGGVGPLQYKWLMHDSVKWRIVGEWQTSNKFAWTPPAWNQQARFGVWVRSAGNTVDAGEVTASMDFPIIPATTTTTTTTTTPTTTTSTTTTAPPITALALSANRVSPQPVGSVTTFTAVPTGGAAPQQYKWLIHDGVSWKAVTGWSTTNTYTLTATSINPSQRIGVWVRSAGVTADAAQFTASMDFAIK